MHTPEPWHVEGAMPLQLRSAAGEVVAKPMANTDMPVEQYRANARRIAACVNACAGIPTEDLEDARFGACDADRGYYRLAPSLL